MTKDHKIDFEITVMHGTPLCVTQRTRPQILSWRCVIHRKIRSLHIRFPRWSVSNLCLYLYFKMFYCSFVSIHYIICECGDTFPTEEALKEHLEREHNHKIEKHEDFRCDTVSYWNIVAAPAKPSSGDALISLCILCIFLAAAPVQ